MKNKSVTISNLKIGSRRYSDIIGEVRIFGDIAYSGLKMRRGFILGFTFYIYGGGPYDGGGIKIFESFSPIIPNLKNMESFRKMLIEKLDYFSKINNTDSTIVIGVLEYLEFLKKFSHEEFILEEIRDFFERVNTKDLKGKTGELLKLLNSLGFYSETQIGLIIED